MLECFAIHCVQLCIGAVHTISSILVRHHAPVELNMPPVYSIYSPTPLNSMQDFIINLQDIITNILVYSGLCKRLLGGSFCTSA